jgi:hypothetical protein
MQAIRDVIHPEDMPAFEAAFKRAIEGLGGRPVDRATFQCSRRT